MDILTWIEKNRPGEIADRGDLIEIAHHSGEHSTLWKRNTRSNYQSLKKLGQSYTDFDGLDLFSSTFKFASIESPKSKNGVVITFSLAQLKEEVSLHGCDFPSNSVPFMYQAGIGYYAVDIDTGEIYECDSESGELSDRYDSLEELMEDWLAAVS